jgi:hypothetical protein
MREPYDSKTPDEPLFFLGFVMSYLMVWWQALPGLGPGKNRGSTLEMVAFTWQIGLVVFQFIWLVIMLIIFTAPFFHEPYSLR